MDTVCRRKLLSISNPDFPSYVADVLVLFSISKHHIDCNYYFIFSLMILLVFIRYDKLVEPFRRLEVRYRYKRKVHDLGLMYQ